MIYINRIIDPIKTIPYREPINEVNIAYNKTIQSVNEFTRFALKCTYNDINLQEMIESYMFIYLLKATHGNDATKEGTIDALFDIVSVMKN